MQEHEHLDFDGWRRLVEALLRGKVRRWLNALGCPVCRRRIRQLIGLQSPQPERSPGSWDEIRDRFRRELARASEDSRQAERVVGRFLEASELQREFWLKNSKLRGNLALCQKVLQRAEKEVRDAPTRARELAALALELVDWVPDEPEHRARLWENCRAAAWLVRGRVHVWCGELEHAEEARIQATRLQGKGSSDPMELGKLLRFEAFLLKTQHRFELARKKALDAIELYRSLGDKTNEALFHLGIAHLHLEAERPRQGIWVLHKTRRFLGSDLNPRMELYLRHNKVAHLCLLHEFSRAERLFEMSQGFYDIAEERVQKVRRPWVCGKIAAGLGRSKIARTQYETTRRMMFETWNDFGAATLALDYGQLYVELGRKWEATRLLEQALPVLRARSLPQVSKAEELLAEAARRDRGPHTPTD